MTRLTFAIILLACSPVAAQNGPDVIVSSLDAFLKSGTVGGITAYSMATTSCNIGDMEAIWEPATNEHPVIAQNLYRLHNGRFEQIGMSWLKHAFCATNEPGCGTCQPTPCNTMGVQCSDTYGSLTNAQQGSLGPRSEVNPFTGAYPIPFGAAGMTGDAIYKRLQVQNSDLDPALNPGALYFGEGIYITTDEQAFGNQNNNASYREVTVGSFDNGGYQIQFTGPVEQEAFGILAWQDQDPDVEITMFTVPGDGMLILGSKATQSGPNSWNYEYALYNYNSDRAAGSFTVPFPAGAMVSNLGFHDVDSHSGEPYSTTDWAATTNTQDVSWATETFTANPNANALRWGTLYNFRFECDQPPVLDNVSVGIFKPGIGSSIPMQGFVPGSCTTPNFIRGDVNADLAVNLVDVVQLLTYLFNSGTAPNPLDAGDGNADTSVNLLDAIYVLTYLFQNGPQPPFPFPQPGCL